MFSTGESGLLGFLPSLNTAVFEGAGMWWTKPLQRFRIDYAEVRKW